MVQPTFRTGTGVGFGGTTEAKEPARRPRPAPVAGQPRFNNGTGVGFAGDEVAPTDATNLNTRTGTTGFNNGTGVGFSADNVPLDDDFNAIVTTNPTTGKPEFDNGTGVGFGNAAINLPSGGGSQVDITNSLAFDDDTRVLTSNVSNEIATVVIPGVDATTVVHPITNTTAFADAQRWYDENNHIFTVVATNVPLEDPTVAAGTGYIEIENIGLDLRKGALDMRQIPRGIHLRG